MTNILDILKKQQYTQEERAVSYNGSLYRSLAPIFLDQTLDADTLAAHITADKTYGIDQALLQDDELKTPLQFLSERCLYQAPHDPLHRRLYDTTTATIIAYSKDSYEQYAEKKYNLLAPVFAALIEPFKEEKANESFTQLLLKQNSAGQTVLHSFFSNFSEGVSFVPITKRILQLTVEQKTCIATQQDKDLKNFFHVLAIRNWHPIESHCNAFGAEATLTALTYQDSQGKTPLHYTFKWESTSQTDVAASYAKLFSQCGQSALTAENAVKTQDFTGSNILHYALSHKDGAKAKAKALVAVALEFIRKHSTEDDKTSEQKELTASQKTLFYSALAAPNHAGLSPFQLACQNGHDEAITLIFEKLDHNQRQSLAKQKNKNGYTALHLACQSGTPNTLDKILDALGSEEIYNIYKTDKNILHKLIESNEDIASELFESKINNKISWFLAHDYIKERSTQSSFFHSSNDLKIREEDFIKLLSSEGRALPSVNVTFSAGRYIQVRARLKPDLEQQKALIQLIEKNKETNSEDYKLASALNPSKVLDEMLTYLEARQKVKPGLLSYKYSDYEDRIKDFIACLKNILNRKELSCSALKGTNYNRLRSGLVFVTPEQAQTFIKTLNEKNNKLSTLVLARLCDAFSYLTTPVSTNLVQGFNIG